MKGKEEKDMSKHLSKEIRVPIELDNPSIMRIEELSFLQNNFYILNMIIKVIY